MPHSPRGSPTYSPARRHRFLGCSHRCLQSQWGMPLFHQLSALLSDSQDVRKAEDDDVCQGLLSEQGPIIAHDLRSISALGQTATKFCDTLLGLCQAPAVNPFTVTFPKPAPTNPKVFTSTGKPPFQAVHFSDVHIDRSYTVRKSSECCVHALFSLAVLAGVGGQLHQADLLQEFCRPNRPG